MIGSESYSDGSENPRRKVEWGRKSEYNLNVKRPHPLKKSALKFNRGDEI